MRVRRPDVLESTTEESDRLVRSASRIRSRHRKKSRFVLYHRLKMPGVTPARLNTRRFR